MRKTPDINKILKSYIDTAQKEKPDFPVWYCNVATTELQEILRDHGIETTKKFTYKDPKDGHTFLLDKEGHIIDPTYAQYDEEYRAWLYAKAFPDKVLNENIMDWQAFMELQLKRYQDDVTVDIP